MIVVSLVIGAACAFAAYNLAEKKGRNPGAWAAVGFLFGLIGLLVLVCMPSRDTESYIAAGSYTPSAERPMRSCPYCVARIEADAAACSYCGRNLPQAA